MAKVKSLNELRTIYGEPKGRALLKQLDKLEKHSINFIQLSPFIVVSTVAANGCLDTSPRGGEAGFVKVLDEQTLGIPDFKGNNRLDSLVNIIETSGIGLMFMIPGVDETLRVNGDAVICNDEEQLVKFDFLQVAPKTYLRVNVKEVFLHCAKALMRSQLWNSERSIERSKLPTIGKMINEQINSDQMAEGQAEMIERYQKEL